MYRKCQHSDTTPVVWVFHTTCYHCCRFVDTKSLCEGENILAARYRELASLVSSLFYWLTLNLVTGFTLITTSYLYYFLFICGINMGENLVLLQ